jgi:hypothetical protein
MHSTLKLPFSIRETLLIPPSSGTPRTDEQRMRWAVETKTAEE